MKLPLDPRLPIQGGQDYGKQLYTRLYDIFRSHAAAVNAVDAAGTQNATDIAARALQTDFVELLNNAQWYGHAVGELFYLDESLGAAIPPTTNTHFRYVRLTAGDAYNSGALTAESVSGMAPLVVATATIAAGPLSGKTIHLLNTEGRFIRSGASGTLQDDAQQNITGRFSAYDYSGVSPSGAISEVARDANVPDVSGSVGFRIFRTNAFDASSQVRTANEVRPRNIAQSAWMRIF